MNKQIVSTANYNGLNHQFDPFEMMSLCVHSLTELVNNSDLDEDMKKRLAKRDRMLFEKALKAATKS